ncbi:MAG: tetratricopeptide repeat protein [Ignavibacteriaceae bacterium]|nr:tetratricopeptide repeat protein [Ignavibacteriaceae bacterium]HRI47137.1 tetratricopeptide repeat protein [Ignavibacteriaceae bacterium]
MKKYLLAFLLTFVVIGCSSKNPSDILSDASEAIKNNQIEQAVKLFEEISNDFPESREAPIALYEMGKIYQSKLVKNVNETESFQKAVDYFDRVISKYENSQEAPLALFMKGFLLANELQKLDEATAAYKLFVTKYPNHELTKSAQDELDYMGLSPEEILKKQSEVASK